MDVALLRMRSAVMTELTGMGGTLSFCLEFFLNSFVFSVKQLSERV